MTFIAPCRRRLGAWLATAVGLIPPPGGSAAPDPPLFSPFGGALRAPASVTISPPDPLGTVFYTLDGSDPRARSGSVALTARRAATPISINRPVVVVARVRVGGEWSSPASAAYTVDQDFSNLLISELMYHPRDSGDDAEFIELVNVGRDSLDVGGLFLRGGSDEAWSTQYFHFPLGTRLQPGAFLVLVRHPEVYRALHPDGPIHGVTTARLNNSYGRVRVESAERAMAAEAAYHSAAPWQVVPDNHGYFPGDEVGFSLVRRDLDPGRDPVHHSSWRASTERFGSPGRDDSPSSLPAVSINELMTRGSGGAPDFVELSNPHDQPVDIGGWWLSDERNFPFRYHIPAGTVVPARGYLVLDESQFGSAVSFSGEGERCYLFSADSAGILTGYSHGFQFSGAARGASFGRHLASDGSESFPVQGEPTPGAPNSGPSLPPPVVISEIGSSEGPGHGPFIELYNRTETDVTLNAPDDPQATWALGGDPEFSHPLASGLVLRAHQCLVLVREDPDGFRQAFGIPPEVPVVLAPEILLGVRAGTPLLLFAPAGRAGDQIRRMTVEQVDWMPAAPWPPGAGAIRHSLQRINPNRFANDPANWRDAPGGASPGIPNPGNLAPDVWAGGPRVCFTNRDSTLQGEVSDDAWDGATATAVWVQTEGPGPVVITTPTAATSRVRFPRPGTYRLRLQATDGVFTAEDTAIIEVRDGGYEAWVQSHFPPDAPDSEAAGRPDSDPDGDGIVNLSEYAFATPPRQADGASPLEIRTFADRWEVAWSQPVTAHDVEVAVESASHLQGPWLADEAFYERNESILGATTRVVARERYPVAGRDRAYIRLRCRLR